LLEIRGDIFIGRSSMGSAMHGDRVLAGNLRRRADGRAEGRIERVLERAQPTVVGRFHQGMPFHYVVPFDDRIASPIRIPAETGRGPVPARHGYRRSSAPELSSAEVGRSSLPSLDPEKLEGGVVEVEITRFPTPTQHATGRILEVLGREGDFGIDVEIVIRKHHLRHRFPPEAEREAAAVP